MNKLFSGKSSTNLSLFGGDLQQPAIFLQACDTTDQLPTVTTPVRVTMNTTDYARGISHSNGIITFLTSGVYFVMAAAQVGMTINSNIDVHLWMRKNNIDLECTNTRAQLSIADDSLVLVSQIVYPFNASDTLTIYQSINRLNKGAGLHYTEPVGEAAIASILTSVFKIG